MANFYHQLYFHLVFGVKCRRASIAPEWQMNLYGIVGGIIATFGGRLIKN